jgi:hypothetical protein
LADKKDIVGGANPFADSVRWNPSRGHVEQLAAHQVDSDNVPSSSHEGAGGVDWGATLEGNAQWGLLVVPARVDGTQWVGFGSRTTRVADKGAIGKNASGGDIGGSDPEGVVENEYVVGTSREPTGDVGPGLASVGGEQDSTRIDDGEDLSIIERSDVGESSGGDGEAGAGARVEVPALVARAAD